MCFVGDGTLVTFMRRAREKCWTSAEESWLELRGVRAVSAGDKTGWGGEHVRFQTASGRHDEIADATVVADLELSLIAHHGKVGHETQRRHAQRHRPSARADGAEREQDRLTMSALRHKRPDKAMSTSTVDERVGGCVGP